MDSFFRSKRKIKKEHRVNRSKYSNIFLILVLVIFGAFSAYPLIMTASNAFKPLDELFLFPPRIFPRNVTFDNFRDLSELMAGSWIPFSDLKEKLKRNIASIDQNIATSF